MSELLSGLVEAAKLAPRYFAPIGAVAGLLLFVPQQWLQKVGVAQLAEDHRPVIGVAFLFCMAVLALAAAGRVAKWIGAWLRARRRQRVLLERLAQLTEDEKQILRYYVSQQTRTNYLRVDDGVVQGLVGIGAIYRSSSMGGLLDGFAFNITAAAWKHLHENHALLVGTTDFYRCDKRDDYFS
ncbi:MAG: hypothetical protein EOO29_11495 [Comamonadaceae bacterium]|nr:MAG: hypothetical protein EOO29_11495 [Comamonadaceae bacterium]